MARRSCIGAGVGAWIRLALAGLALGVAGCASGPPARPPMAVDAVPAAWAGTLPDSTLAGAPTRIALTQWWRQFDDPLLSELIEAAQEVSPTAASAALRIEQARLASLTSSVAAQPTVDAQATALRGRVDPGAPLTTTQSLGLQASWELDVFGAQRAAQQAAQARWDGAQAGWHDARVVVAAEVAQAYVNLRACQAQTVAVATDARSRDDTARLTERSAQVGFQSSATAALARAGAAQGQMQLIAQRAQCLVQQHALTALTGWAPSRLEPALSARTARLPQPAQLAVAQVPAQVLAQRPDVFNAEREVLAAEAGVLEQRALQYPRISLLGSISRNRVDSGRVSQTGAVWSVGPVSVTFPVWDGGLRRAGVRLAQAQVDEARTRYAATVRRAVQEVEEALVQLQSADERQLHSQLAVRGFAQAFHALQTRFRVGSVSLLELEDARRSLAQAQSAQVALQQAHVTAWISLYRALGGGWTPDTAPSQTPSLLGSTP